MSQRTGKKGHDKPRASPKLNAETIEDFQAIYEDKLKHMEAVYEDRLKLMEANLQGQIDTMHRLLMNKDETIGKLNVEIGELKKSLDLISNETLF